MKKFLLAVLFVFGVLITAYAQEAVTNSVVTENESSVIVTETAVVPAVVEVPATPSFNILEVLKKIPALKQGFAFSVLDSTFNYMTTFDIFNYKGFNVETGYMGAAKNTGDKLVAVASYDLWDAKKSGVTIPVLDLVKFRPGIYAGTGRILGSSEFDAGVSMTIMDVKF